MTVAHRLLLMAAVSAAVTLALALASADAVGVLVRADPSRWGRAELSAALVAALGGLGSLGASWHLISAAVAIAATRTPRGGLARTAVERWGAPLVRRIAVGALLAGAAAPAAAAQPPGPDAPYLGWRPTSSQTGPTATPASSDSPATDPSAPSAAPDPGAGSTPESSSAPLAPEPPSGGGGQGAGSPRPRQDAAGSTRDAGSAPSPGTGEEAALVVEPGQSLWSISAARLGPRASAADIARAWPRLYRANEGTIGSEPGLIRPGQRLTVPEDLAPPERD
ncbi:LysM peptidoglycan-binding domain-containing protein [Actinomyces gaoshouyii]|uniref:LysM peptidoglycan-binding domain-containing protein n=1 Tax=Actinomyces gaoshouyii TaxID=1960083 RepID=UPI0009BD2009|nr:LysM peptidoglycan-binding domain-containing protein [Actinomyces gaoshouyii]ARD42208.1 hypothetical protein B6G06_07495 [Actinomyces gaoshouyii]